MRRNTRWRSIAAAGCAAVLSMASMPSATGAAYSTVVRWDFDGRSAVHPDTSGHGIDATSGPDVQLGVAYSGAVGIFTKWIPNHSTPPTAPGRLTRANHPSLNPGTRNFAITIRFRTTQNYGNIIQKGQAGAAGGNFKLEIPNGRLACVFRGTSGQVAVNSGTRKLNDGRWHTVRCERKGTRVTMTIDNGTTVRRGNGPTGNISNNVELTISGKGNCNQTSITCDYFAGGIDYVLIEAD